MPNMCSIQYCFEPVQKCAMAGEFNRYVSQWQYT
jgi:hypothetical protein